MVVALAIVLSTAPPMERLPLWVKRRNTRCEHKFSALLLIADIRPRLLPLIACRMRQRLLVLKYGTEIEHIEISAAGFAFPKPFRFTQRLATGLLADDLAASNWWWCKAGEVAGHGIIL